MLLDQIFLALIAAVVPVIGGYIVVRMTRQDKALNEIHMTVNSRLDSALRQIADLERRITVSQTTGQSVPPEAV